MVAKKDLQSVCLLAVLKADSKAASKEPSWVHLLVVMLVVCSVD